MNNYEKYRLTYLNVLNLDSDNSLESLCYRDRGWDSVAHMVLMSEIENAFDIMLDTDDVIDFSSFEKGKEILRKYGIEL